jgi:hypothetical protein
VKYAHKSGSLAAVPFVFRRKILRTRIINLTEKPLRNQIFFIHFTVFGRIKLTSSHEIIYNIFVHLKNRSVFI